MDLCMGNRRNNALDSLYDVIGLIRSKVWTDWQAENLGGVLLGHREAASAEAQRGICLLQVRWPWIVDYGRDPSLRELLLQAIAIGMADDIQMPRMTMALSGRCGRFQQRAEGLVVPLGNDASARVPLTDAGKLGGQDGRLYRVKATVVADCIIVVLGARAIIAQHTYASCQRFVIGRDCTAVTEAPQVLAGVEAPSNGMTMSAYAAPAIDGSVRLRRILEHEQAMAVGNTHKRIEVGWLAIQVHGNNALGLGRDSGRYLLRVNVEAALGRLDRNWRCAALAHREPRGDECVTRHDDLVTGSDIQCQQGQFKCIESVRDTHGVAGSTKVRKRVFKAIHFSASYVAAAVEYPLDCFVDLGLQFEVGGFQIKEWNVHSWHPIARRNSL